MTDKSLKKITTELKMSVESGLPQPLVGTNILPYTLIVGQEQLKLALELVYICPRIGGVLLSGQRGTGKSTAVRAFTKMMFGKLPITLPINATEDRVIGGWKIEKLMLGKLEEKPGLLEKADRGLLYIDEVNLLDDHIVNIILDVTSTGILEVQREGQDKQLSISLTLVGTMNPEEGGLRPQLLDRFGLMVSVKAEPNQQERLKILQTVLAFEQAINEPELGDSQNYIAQALTVEEENKQKLAQAKKDFSLIKISENIAKKCVNLAAEVSAEGHRGDYIIALAARAYAALVGAKEVTNEHIKTVAQLALQHRVSEGFQKDDTLWHEKYQPLVEKILNQKDE